MRALLAALAVCVICLVPAFAGAETTFTAPPMARDCSADVTQAITSWIASVPDNSVLDFDSGACYRIEGTIEVTNRNGLVFDGNGSTFRATTTNAPSYRAQWRLTRGSGLVLRDMILRGADPTPGTLDDALQHQHGVDLRGTAGVELDRVRISDTYGDCVYVGQPWNTVNTWTSNVHMHDSSCTGAGRNGVAVVAGRDVRIETSSFARVGLNTFGLEPNGAGFGARNVTITRNQVGAVAYSVLAALSDSPIENVTFSQNTLVGKAMVIAALPPSGRRYVDFEIVGNVSDTGHNAPGSTAMQFVRIDGLTVTGNTAPLSGQNMALVSVAESCAVSISGNSYPGGVTESRVTPYSACAAPPPVAAPSISSLSPTSGPVGTSVTISGANLSGATAVTLAGRAAQFTVVSASQVRATVPSGASNGSFAVTTPGGTATSGSFTVVVPVAAPSISSLSPTSGPVGTSVTITGTNLGTATSVTLAGRAAQFTVVSASQVRATVPTGATSGPFAVTTPGGTATSGSFTVAASAAAPSISSLSSSSGPVGTSVTITGTNLGTATSVTLDGRPVPYVVMSATQIVASVPAGATSGSFVVTTPDGTATSKRFRVMTPSRAPKSMLEPEPPEVTTFQVG
jgi:IPT/TIG domain-containing protein